MSYAAFLERKARTIQPSGRVIATADVHPLLHDWQREIVRWAVGVGRAAVWADTGLGKTMMQLEWARLSGTRSLIVAPLAVCHQTVREAAKLGIDVRYVRQDEHGGLVDPRVGIRITNYELATRFDPDVLDAVVLDEASILKNETGRTRNALIQHFAGVPHRLACTATPAPNDQDELTNQAEFLGVTSRVEMLAAYFVHDADGWRPKGHAKGPMYRWMASWAVALRRPSDLGPYTDDGYELPGLDIETHLLPVAVTVEGALFGGELGGVGGRAKVRKATLRARCEMAAELVAKEPDEPWILWCGLNDEASTLAKLIPDAVNIHGAMTPEEKAQAALDFTDGRIRVLVSKPAIFSWGMNWQHCARMAFVGLSDSYEAYYQCLRRCYRYGQTRPVHAHIVLTELEAPIAQNIFRKEADAEDVHAALVKEMRQTSHWSTSS